MKNFKEKRYKKKSRVKKTLADIRKRNAKRRIIEKSSCLKKAITPEKHTPVVSKPKVNEKPVKIIQLSANKTDGAKVITFKEKIITKNAA